MDQMDDEIMTMFVEDTREHLGDIESALMDMERDGADIDEELVNKVFRAFLPYGGCPDSSGAPQSSHHTSAR